MLDFIRSATEDLAALPFFSRPVSADEGAGTFPISLDFTRASRQLETFLAGARKQMRLTADASGIISAASTALSRVRAMFDSADITLKVNVETEGSPGASGSSGRAGSFSAVPSLMLSTGGRFSSPTHAEIAEDGDPEYVVPVRKENEAVPLIRSLFSELSASARESLRDVLPASFGVIPSEAEGSFHAFAAIPDLFSSATAAATPVVQQVTSGNVSAPVNIRVESSAADPEAVGRSIYDTAERYLLRTLQTVS